MWVLNQKDDGTVYLHYDHYRRYNYQNRGRWEWMGTQNNAFTDYCAAVNRAAGHIVANDDQNGVRVLVLE